MRKLLVALLGCAILAAAERVPAEQPRQSKEAPVCCVVIRRAEGTVYSRLVRIPDGRLRFERFQIE